MSIWSGFLGVGAVGLNPAKSGDKWGYCLLWAAICCQRCDWASSGLRSICLWSGSPGNPGDDISPNCGNAEPYASGENCCCKAAAAAAAAAAWAGLGEATGEPGLELFKGGDMGEEEEGESEAEDAWKRAWKGDEVGGDGGKSEAATDDFDGTMVGGLELCDLIVVWMSLFLSVSNMSLAVLDQTDDLGGEDGLKEDDFGDGMTSDDKDWGGGVGNPLFGCGDEDGCGEPDLPFMLCCMRQWILNQLDLLPYLDPDFDIPTIRHFLRRHALQAVRFFLSTTHR